MRQTSISFSSSVKPSLLLLLLLALCLGAGGCGSDQSGESAPESVVRSAPEEQAPPAPPAPAPSISVESLPTALVLGLAQFAPRPAGSKDVPKPLPARLEFLAYKDGEWTVTGLDDEASNVFHKAMLYDAPGADPRLLSVAGTAATVKLWSKGPDGLEETTLWEKDFGGRFSRMRDVEVADIFGDGKLSMAVATHDQGVVATLHPDDAGGFEVVEIDEEEETFVHEIEIGDLDGDGMLEVYATPSEPNRLDGSEQSGRVVRYVPAKGEGRVVVADLGMRHAKEILVEDVDGDGRDELYVAVEGHVKKGSRELDRGVEILRFDAGTDPKEGVVIAEIRDRLLRFLTAGDLDGDGKKELAAAAFSSGLWLLTPGEDPRSPWKLESIDRDSGGFEHATIATDLDGDGVDELYVASDKHKEVRRYVWNGSSLVREVIHRRTDDHAIFTWNLMPVPVSLVP